MGWLDILGALFGESTNSSTTPVNTGSGRSRSRSSSSRGAKAGKVYKGKVAFVGAKFAKLEASEVEAIVFLSEMADHYIEDPASILTEGQELEFVLLREDHKGWKASIRAVAEAKARKALEKIEEGQVLNAKVKELHNRGVILEAKKFSIWVPLSEISWQWIDHPGDEVSLGQMVEVKILRIECQGDWLKDRRARNARAVASIRECSPRPESEIIPVAFSVMPFMLWAAVRAPINCDPVSLYVLEELVNGQSLDDVVQITGLTESAIDGIKECLSTEGLLRSGEVSNSGHDLVAAIDLARELQEEPVKGRFASAAPLEKRLLAVDKGEGRRKYPSGWARPPFDRRRETVFSRAADDELPEVMVERLVPEELQPLIRKLKENKRISVFLRKDGKRSWEPVYIDVSKDWFFEGLWRLFDVAFGAPYRPAPMRDCCSTFLMIQCVYRGESDATQEKVLYEPNTRTLWKLKSDSYGGKKNRLRVHKVSGRKFPETLNVAKEMGSSDSIDCIVQLEPESWCVVRGG